MRPSGPSLTRLLSTSLAAAALALAAPITGQAADERLELPSAGLATGDGVLASPTNPGLQIFDPDPALVAHYRQGLGQTAGMHLGAGAGGLGLGLLYLHDPAASSRWAIQNTMSLKLGRRLSFGTNLWWHLPSGGGDSFTTWDLGLGWRPRSYLGFGAVALDLGAPGGDGLPAPRYGAGLAVRPMGDRLMLGLDGLFREPGSGGGPMEQDARLTLSTRPIPGLLLSAHGSVQGDFGGGLQVHFGGTGAALGAAGVTGAPALTGSVYSVSPPERLIPTSRKVPLIHLKGSYPYESIATLFSAEVESYLDLLRRIQIAVEDEATKGLILHLDDTPFSVAQIQEIRGLLAPMKEQGRPLVIYMGESTGNGAYLLASMADHLVLHPAADLNLIGFSMELSYFRGTMDLIGVENQVVRRGRYKSAPESQTRTSPSEESAEQVNALLDDLDGALVGALAAGRGVPEARVRSWIDGGPWTARRALEEGMVDDLLYPDQLEDSLADVFPGKFKLDEDYMKVRGTRGWTHPRRIAVILVNGVITTGPSMAPGLLGGGTAGSDTVVKALRQAEEDGSVKAVVVRIDSPGGSAFASDVILRAVKKLRASGKPVVVSMGGLAASGGYYIASGADLVLAEPATITGSIGVYGGKMNVEGLYEKIGVSSTLFTRGRKAGMWSPSRPLDPLEMEALDALVEDTYSRFKAVVAEGRSMEIGRVEELAQGRIWSGVAALEVGLVDELGGLDDAVERAREAARIKPGRYELFHYRSRAGSLGDLPGRTLQAALGLAGEPPRGLPDLQRWKAMEDDRVLMVLPYEVEIQ